MPHYPFLLYIIVQYRPQHPVAHILERSVEILLIKQQCYGKQVRVLYSFSSTDLRNLHKNQSKFSTDRLRGVATYDFVTTYVFVII